MEVTKVILVVLAVIALGVGDAWALHRNKKTLYSEPQDPIPGPRKNYTGYRVREDSMRLIYYNQQTIAVVEVGPARELFNCELLEVRTDLDRQTTLNTLIKEVPTQIKISFPDMLDLMIRCEKLDLNFDGAPHNRHKREEKRPPWDLELAPPEELVTLFKGIFPGTKWCGPGNIASTYHDLGVDRALDKCCRTHDHCPVKVKSFRTQYNITNYSVYTKTHCACDDMFYDCLKAVGSVSSTITGGVFFNVLKPWCVEDVPSQMVATTTKRFTWRHRWF